MRNLFLLAITAMLFGSCVQKRFIHAAPPVLNPMFRDQGDAFVSAGYTSNDGGTSENNTNDIYRSSNGAMVQGGYAFSRHLGVAGSLSYIGQKDIYPNGYATPFDASNVKYSRADFTLAGDYFLVNKKRSSGINLLWGATLGKLKISDYGKLATADYTRFFNANSFALFVQPSLNFYFSNYTGMGLSARVNYLSYQTQGTNYTNEELDKLRLNKINALYVAEFGFKGKIGLSDFPLVLEPQLNYIWNHSGRIHVRRANVSLGVSWQFRRKIK